MDMRLQHGFSLVEVLVTLLTLKVGLLGVLAAQTFSLRQLQDATQRTQAVALSYSLLSEVRANPDLAERLASPFTRQTELPFNPVCNVESVCTSEQVAAMQLNSWSNSLQTSAGGSLFDPAFCLQAQDGAVMLAVSWQQRVTNVPTSAQCNLSDGRSAFVVSGNGG